MTVELERGTKLAELLVPAEVVTATGTLCPVANPLGTATKIAVSLQLTMVAVTPANVTALLPWVDPKFEPETHYFSATFEKLPPPKGPP